MRKFVVVGLATLLALPTGGHVASAAPMMFAPSGPRLVHDALVSDVVQVQVRRDRNVRQ
jgi:hypothetical protein